MAPLMVDPCGYLKPHHPVGRCPCRTGPPPRCSSRSSTPATKKGHPTIVTTNRGLPDWGDIFGDSVIAAAILDRLMHNAVVFNIRGPRRNRSSLWVPIIRSCALTRHDALASWEPMYRVLSRFFASLARLAVRSRRSKDLRSSSLATARTSAARSAPARLDAVSDVSREVALARATSGGSYTTSGTTPQSILYFQRSEAISDLNLGGGGRRRTDGPLECPPCRVQSRRNRAADVASEGPGLNLRFANPA